MTREQWERLRQLFHRCLDFLPEERARFIEGVKGQDEQLGRELEALIQAETTTRSNPPDSPSLDIDAFAPGDDPLFTEGEIIANRFRIVSLLGRGGMGDVYEANDIELGPVALKTIRRRSAFDDQALLRFRHEVQLALKVTHPNVCRIYQLHTEPVAFLSMELLRGMTLANRIEDGGALHFAEALRLALQLCAALEAIHDAGIIHRDLKANNVMLVERHGKSRAVIMDLGLAREIRAEKRDSSLTQEGAVMGTPEYMAPEQGEGCATTPATDIYAMGVLLYELCTGKRPFQAPSAFAAAMKRGRRLTPVSAIQPGVPRYLDVVIGKCLEYEPADRYQSASELAEALRNPPRPETKLKRITIRAKSRPRVMAAVILAGVVLGMGIAAVLRKRKPAEPPAEAQLWYRRGVAALREGTYFRATRAMYRAVGFYPDYALAHARLADAWNELDFAGKAAGAMIRASNPEILQKLPSVEQMYVDAVRATLTRNFSEAVKDYKEILSALPEGEKAYGHLDLGRALEKARNVPEARKHYAEAARLAPEDPAAFVRLGVLEDRRGDSAAAERAYIRAETLYGAASNAEGLAEIDYQRGYTASQRRDLPAARKFFENCLHAAREPGNENPQLEIRTLTRLSVLEYSAEHLDRAVELANSAIRLAQEKDVQYWAIEGMIRLGNIYVDLRRYSDAAATEQKGLQLARENQIPRLQALANISLANLHAEEHKPDETITEAQAALDYYKAMDDFDMSITSLEFIVQSEGDRAEFQRALPVALGVLENTRKANKPVLTIRAEELVGSVLLSLQRYPEALRHYQAALETGRLVGQPIEYQMLHCADALWRLGRFSDAEQMLGSISGASRSDPRLADAIELVIAQMKLAKRQFQEALRLARHNLAGAKDAATAAEFEMIVGQAQARSGKPKEAIKSCQTALSAVQALRSQEMVAEASLCSAGAYASAGLWREAAVAAETAQAFFSRSQQHESEWMSLSYLALASHFGNDSAKAKQYSQKAMDILSGLEHNWGIPTYTMYISRPDLNAAMRELSRITS